MPLADAPDRVPERIATERLVLRPVNLRDAAPMFARWARDPEATRYLSWRAHERVEQTLSFLAVVAADWKRSELLRRVWTITGTGDDTAIGQVSLRFDGQRATLGYVLARPFWGRGLATEAARAAVAAALALPAIQLVWAYCDVDNRASARVMEKAGMRSEGVLRRWAVHPNLSDTPRDVVSYSVARP